MIDKPHQMVPPIVISGGKECLLQPLPPDDHSYNEAWFQDLLFRHPALIPSADIDPIFGGLIPLAKELECEGGFIDLLYVNDFGAPTLVETKLYRNPESRRKALAQIIDYAKDLSTWSYEDLFQAVEQATPGITEAEFIESAKRRRGDFNLNQFRQALSANLKRGRFLLAIIGDRIPRDMEQMVEFLNQAPQLHFTLGLVEVALYSLPGESKDHPYIQPRLLARTREITRAVIEIRNGTTASVNVAVPAEANESKLGGKLNIERFLELLASGVSPEAVHATKALLEQAPMFGIQLAFAKQSVNLLFRASSNDRFSMGRISVQDHSVVIYLHEPCLEHHLPDQVWQEYYDAIRRIEPQAESGAEHSREGESYTYLWLPNGDNGLLPKI